MQALSAHAVTRTFPKSTVIISEGDPAESLYIIVSGRVKVFVADPGGREIVLLTQGPGEYFGEMMLDEGPRSASIMTLDKSVFLVIRKADLREFLVRNPGFAVRLIEKLIHRVRSLTASVKSLALMDVYGRVARLLLELAEERDGVWVIGERLTQQDIASRVGASREMVSRIFKDLTDGGYVAVQRDCIVVNRKPPPHW
ncbi:MAG: Crp/Fnr family transcriptional regulator [Betaproteobacteria bacterium RIFCSPLOWO2_12_FULL_67_28]|nr:MAG: Crp/Fnr family transcriptional regulator [Betaproteobacteria bacterium RIFCSPLOWO2_02_FULL_68_150]OGA64976.1 MAG: Crp/Fnr family transcriptional regulator [Betaproteobacteria bacterium RIFCSPLOWO2_12_FULL_67_28]